MIKFILPIAVFIAAVYGISYYWTNSNSKGKKKIALGLIIALIIGISLTIFLIFD
jgi:lipopolysaccharide export LptBFGC system permease protein LptF